MKKVFIQQPLMPHYRAPFFVHLAASCPYLFYLSFDSDPQKGFIPIKPDANNIYYLKSSWKLKFGIVFNFSILRYLFRSFDLYVFNDNVRSPALLIFLVINYLLGRPSLLWGHAVGTTHPGMGLVLRRIFLFFSSGYIAYNCEGRDVLKELIPHKPVFLASNSLDTNVFLDHSYTTPSSPYLTHKDLALLSDSDIVLIYSSRLEPEKCPFKLLDLLESLHDLECRSSLIVIGDGSLFDAFRARIMSSSVLSSNVFLLGSISDPSDLAYIFSFADFLVHPGVIGLTIQMAFCLSTPVITSIDAKHMPEFTIFKNYSNGLLVDFSDIQGVARQIIDVKSDVDLHASMKINCYDSVYSANGVNIQSFVREFKYALSLSFKL